MYPMTVGDEMQYALEDDKKRKTRTWHWDQAEHYADLAAQAGGGTGPQEKYSEWCQRQALIHATLASAPK